MSTRARVALELDLLTAELDLHQHLIISGVIPPDARRTLTPAEVRSRVRFADLKRLVDDTADRIVGHVQPVADTLVAGLTAIDTTGLDPWQAAALVARLANPAATATIPGLVAAVNTAAAAVRRELADTVRAAADAALVEYRHQQGTARLAAGDPGDPPVDLTAPPIEQASAASAERVPAQVVTRLLGVAQQAAATAARAPGASGSDVTAAAADAARDVDPAGTVDQARQAANIAQSQGRTAALVALPDPAEVYASELLDSNTCVPCSHRDGQQYATLADALDDYPGAGGYLDCQGAARCRGTLVVIHASEQDRAVDPALRPPPPDLPPAPRVLPPKPIADRDLTGLDDDALSALLGEAQTDADADAVLAELDRRDEAAAAAQALAAKRAKKAAYDRARNTARAEAEAARRDQAYDRAIEAGQDPESAYEDVYGVTVAQQRRNEAIAQLRGNGYPGRNFDELSAAAFRDHAEQARWDAEAATRGALFNRPKINETRNVGLLFTGPEAYARANASEELLAYWQANGRLTLEDYRASLLGGELKAKGTAAWY